MAEGLVMSALPLTRVISERSFCQAILPVVRSTQVARILDSVWTVRKMRSSKTMGVLAPRPPSAVFQTRVLAGSRVAGRLVSELEPLRFGPRHWAQLSAKVDDARRRIAKRDGRSRILMMKMIPFMKVCVRLV